MPKGNCEFNGSGRDYLGLFVIHLFLLSMLTLGIYSPWAWVRLFKLKASHTLINGKQVTFTGTGSNLFIICLVNILLTIITLGIYSPWAICRISKWKAQNTLVGGKQSDFVGTGGRLFIFYIVHLMILPMLTLGIYYFYSIYRYYAWKEEHMKYGGEKTSFGSGFWGLIKIFLASSLIWLLLPIIAQFLSLPSIDLLALIILILLAPWFICMFFRWQIKGLTVGDEEDVEHFPPVKTSFLLVAVLILTGLFALVAAGLFIRDRYRIQISEITDLTQFLEMRAKDLRKPEAIRVPVKRPSHLITPRPGTKALPREVPPKEALAPKLAKKHLPEKPTSKKPHVPALPSPAVKPVLESKDYDRGIRELDELIRQDRQNADLYYSRGCLYERKGDLENAEKDFTKAIDINYRDKDAYYNRGLVFVKMKKYGLAVKDFDKVIELDSRAVDAYCNRGSANYQLGRSDLAIRDYNEALKLSPKDGDLFYNRGVVNLSKGMKTEAKADFKKAAMLGHRLAPKMISRQE
ncbi:MAG: DUF898 family protein [Deltaproteobacteria bacterium]|nr:DUF898 family protein [Deltaproteobacteria bacterium]MBL7225214.1 DUF898 family protein [Desulfobacteraceae bacterium]